MARNKDELKTAMVAAIESFDFQNHVLKHFVSVEEAQKVRDLSGEAFSVFTGIFNWGLVRSVLVNWAEKAASADQKYESILRQTEDCKEYRMVFNAKSTCGIRIPEFGKAEECESFTLYFKVFRNVFWGRAEYRIQLKSVYPTTKK